MAKYRCPDCLNDVTMTTGGKWRSHQGNEDGLCPRSGEQVPPRLILDGPSDAKDDKPVKGRDYDKCPACGRMPRLNDDGSFAIHMLESGSEEECPLSGKSIKAQKPIPGALKYEKGMANAGPLVSNAMSDRTMPCPEPGCGRNPTVQQDGTFIAHMPLGGNTACPMSSMPSQAQPKSSVSSDGSTQIPLPKAPASPPNALTLPGMGTAIAAPTHAAVPDTDLPRSSVQFAVAMSPGVGVGEAIVEALRDAVSSGTASTPEAHAGAAQASFEPRFCGYCKQVLGAFHDCVPVPFEQPAPLPDEHYVPPEFGGPDYAELPFSQPAAVPRVLEKAQPMSVQGAEIASQLKEMFFAYSNRMARNVQETLGPSEIGSPCDRRIAMSLMRIAPVNPGGDNWASFVGTCIHVGLAEMFMWANAGTGRYATEVPLSFPSEIVPKGTSDLLDRTLFIAYDHKAMGRWSLDKLRTVGPNPTYRVQVHTYAYGQRLKGETVKYVAIIGWPRENATLADLYVWVEEYQPEIAQKALARVEGIAMQLEVANVQIGNGLTVQGNRMAIAKSFDVQDDCKFCPFLAKGDVNFDRGCNGRV